MRPRLFIPSTVLLLVAVLLVAVPGIVSIAHAHPAVAAARAAKAPPTAAAELTTRAFAAYTAGDVEGAQRNYLLAAASGDAAACYNAAVIRLNDESNSPDEGRPCTFCAGVRKPALRLPSTCSVPHMKAASSCLPPGALP